MRLLKRLLADESGYVMTEYAIMLGAIAFGAIVTFIALGTRLRGILSSVQGDLNQVPTS